MNGLAVSILCLLAGLPLWPQDCVRVPDYYSAEMRLASEPKIQFQRTLCRYLVPAWSHYLGKHQESYRKGFHQGVRYALESLEWAFLDLTSVIQQQKGKDLGFRMGFLAACEAYVVLQRQRPALGLDGNPVPPSLYPTTKRAGSVDWDYWGAVTEVFTPHWGAFSQAREQDYNNGFRDCVVRILGEFRFASADFGIRTALKETAPKPPAYQMGFVAALEAYSAYQLMSPERQTPGIHPLTLHPVSPAGQVPIVASPYYDQPETYHLKETPDHTGKTILEILGPETMARIVAFAEPSLRKGSDVSLERCKRAFEQFKVASPISYAHLRPVRGFIEMKDGRILNWILEEHFGVLQVGEERFFREQKP